MLVVPARKEGENPAAQPEAIARGLESVVGACELYGVRVASTGSVPQPSGVAKTARDPPKSVSFKSSNGCWGRPSSVAVKRPVSGSA